MADEADVKDAPASDAAAEFEATQAAAEAGADPSVSVDELASQCGWAPLDAWRGDPADWQPAAEFLKSTVLVNKRLRGELKDLKRSIDKTTTQMAEEKFAKLRASLEAKLEDAVETGDKAAAKQVSAELAKLQAEQASGGMGERNGYIAPPAFLDENPWYGENEEATDYALSVANRAMSQGKSFPEQLEAARTAVVKRFPELFEAQPRRKAPPAVHDPGGRNAGQRSGGTGWNDLPADVQRDMERAFIRTGMVTDKALLAKNWFDENKGN